MSNLVTVNMLNRLSYPRSFNLSMKTLLRFTGMISIATYLYLICYPISKIAAVTIESPRQSIAFISDPENSSWTPSRNNQVNYAKNDKTARIITSIFKLIVKPFRLSTIKLYFQYNNLNFNVPFICYKFPLSEHTEEG